MAGLIEAASEISETPADNQDPSIAAAAAEEVAAAPTEEFKKEEPAQTEEDKRFAAKFAALNRREKIVAAKEKQATTRMKELEDKIKAMEAKPVETEAAKKPLERRLKEAPFETLKELGLDFETLTRMALNDGRVTPEIQQELAKEDLKSELMGQIQELRAKLEEKEKSDKEAADRAQEERSNKAVSDFKTGISSYIDQNKETLELVSVEGADGIELIYDVVLSDYQTKKQELEETGEDTSDIQVITIEDAAKMIEEQLLEEAKKRIGLSKIKKLVEPLSAVPASTKQEPKKTASPTLSNDKSQVQGKGRAYLSQDESKAEAAKLLRWTE